MRSLAGDDRCVDALEQKSKNRNVVKSDYRTEAPLLSAVNLAAFFSGAWQPDNCSISASGFVRLLFFRMDSSLESISRI